MGDAANDVELRWRRRKRLVNSFWFNAVAAILVVALVQAFLLKLYFIPSGSMENTLMPGDRVLVSRVAYIGSSPATGDIIIFNASEAWEEPENYSHGPIERALKWIGALVGIGPGLEHTLAKRVIAGPGQTLSCCGDGGQILVDGEPLHEPYVTNDFDFVPGEQDCSTVPISRRCVSEFTVPSDQYIVLGDNRSASSDSLWHCRGAPSLGDCVRTVNRSDIVGKAFVIVWPLTHAGVPLPRETSSVPGS